MQTRRIAVLALALLAACEHEQPIAKPSIAPQPAATKPAPAPTPEAKPAPNERLKPEPSLTDVFVKPEKPDTAPPSQITTNDDGSLTVREFYPSGWLYTERGEKTGADGKRVRNGPLKVWHENRQLWQIGAYVDGKLSGPVRYWDDMGQRETEGAYDQGLRESDWSMWHPNGQMKSTGFYHVNLAEGPWKFWHDNGQLEAEGEFVNNKRVGQWLYFKPDGSPDVEKTGTYEDNHRVR